MAVLGLAFKPDTDDMRESPAIPIIRYLLDKKALVRAYDPVAENEARKIFGKNEIGYCDDLLEAVSDVDAIILVTRWEEFEEIPAILSGMTPPPLFIDGRRMLQKDLFERYEGIGL